MNCIIVHGSNVRDEEKLKQGAPPQNKRHWIPWLKREVEKKGVKCSTPLMPENWNPKYKDWKKEFEKNKIDENTILIGASVGAGFLLRYLSEKKITIQKLILIAPAFLSGEGSEYLKEFQNFSLDSSIKEVIEKIIVFTSDDDKKQFIEGAKIVEKKLNAKLIELKNHGHFCLGDMGTKEFPELLKEVLE